MILAAYAGVAIAVVALIVILEIHFAPDFAYDKLQSTPNTSLTDDQIISQTNKIQAVKEFMVKHPNPKVNVYRYDDQLVHVIYSNATNLISSANGNTTQTIATLEILLGEMSTYAQDSNSTSMTYNCGNNIGRC